jgi:dTDP-4-amino-4,6-dideoxygalactose transaminase
MNHMISQLISKGYDIKDPWDAVTIFENKLAEYAGSKYAVCVDSCSNAMFLCLKYLGVTDQVITLPAHTYASTPMQCIHAGNRIKFEDIEWSGDYFLTPTPVVDGATRFRRGMYIPDSYYCVSFHHRKTLKIGKGGVILTDDIKFVDWCRPMIYDGRHKYVNHAEDDYECIGYHMYMTPEEAAKGILLLEEIADINPDTGSSSTYKDLRLQPVFDSYKV